MLQPGPSEAAPDRHREILPAPGDVGDREPGRHGQFDPEITVGTWFSTVAIIADLNLSLIVIEHSIDVVIAQVKTIARRTLRDRPSLAARFV